MAWRAEVKTASTPSPSSLPSMGVPECSRMVVPRAPSSSRAFARKAASPSRSVRAVESAMSAKRMMAVPEGSCWKVLVDAGSVGKKRKGSDERWWLGHDVGKKVARD